MTSVKTTLILLSFFLIGCSGTGQRLSESASESTAFPENEFGTIFIARKSQVYGSGVTIYVEANGKELGDLGVSEYLYAPALSGVNNVKSGLAGFAGTVAIGDNSPMRSFMQESRTNRYFLVSLKFDLFSPQINMEEVSQQTWLRAAK